jgi:hypothetical protein
MKNLKNSNRRYYYAYVDQNGIVEKENTQGKYIKVEIEYSKGGRNYFSGNYNKRGYRVSFKPVEVNAHIESYTLLGDTKSSGGYIMITESNRYSAKVLESLAQVYDHLVPMIAELYRADKTNELIDLIQNKAPKQKPKAEQYARLSKNLCAKTRPVDNPYEIWQSLDGTWEWRVLKKWQSPEKERNNPYARWFCAVKSPMTYGDYEYGDTYVKDVVKYARLIKGTPNLQAVDRKNDKANVF